MASASTVAPVASGSELKRRMKRNHDDDKEESNADDLHGNGCGDVEMEVETAEHGGSGYDLMSLTAFVSLVVFPQTSVVRFQQ